MSRNTTGPQTWKNLQKPVHQWELSICGEQVLTHNSPELELLSHISGGGWGWPGTKQVGRCCSLRRWLGVTWDQASGEMLLPGEGRALELSGYGSASRQQAPHRRSPWDLPLHFLKKSENHLQLIKVMQLPSTFCTIKKCASTDLWTPQVDRGENNCVLSRSAELWAWF